MHDKSCPAFPISIHALREEGDSYFGSPYEGRIRFLSTPSARRATRTSVAPTRGVYDFYPRPPRGGRRTADR